MKLISLEIDEPSAGWQLERATFLPDVTLLVGLSGVGKTRILDSIRKLSSISKGKSSPQFFGINWKFEFQHDGKKFIWSGAFENSDLDSASQFSPLTELFEDDDHLPKPSLVVESLEIDGNIIAKRNSDGIVLRGEKTPKLSTNESLIHILKNEEDIDKAYAGMDSILLVDQSEYRPGYYSFRTNFESLKNKYTTLQDIRSADMPTHQKLALTHENCKDTFSSISEQFRDAFPYVKEIGINLIDCGPAGKMPRIYMREEGVHNIIQEESISSGMHRTLMHLSRMSLWPDGTVVLVDEFENSFGINCIDYVTDDLQTHSQRMQFVLTSHHPYIINNIDKKHWMIVSRDGDTVKVKDSDILKNSASHHEAFLQLLNLPQYSDGIAIAE